jgi:hypothetical protein
MRWVGTWAAACVGLTAMTVSMAHAQVCEEDAATACVDDAGVEDGGAPLPAQPRVDAGSYSGGADVCSCSSEYRPNDEGYLHICTGSFERDACADLTCEQGRLARVACSDRNARLCCDMPDRGLYTQLYDDCTHPRCELGFRAQCEDFGGRVHLGPCAAPISAEDDDSGACSALPGRSRDAGLAGWLLLTAAVVLARRRRA